MCLGDPWHGSPVVPDADERAAERMHESSAEFPGPQAGAIDDGIDSIPSRQRLFLLAQGTADSVLEDAAAGPRGPRRAASAYTRPYRPSARDMCKRPSGRARG